MTVVTVKYMRQFQNLSRKYDNVIFVIIYHHISMLSIINMLFLVFNFINIQLVVSLLTFFHIIYVLQCIDVLGSHTSSGSETSALAAELLSILGGLEVESVIQAHDQAAALLDPSCFNRVKRNKVRITTLGLKVM